MDFTQPRVGSPGLAGRRYIVFCRIAIILAYCAGFITYAVFSWRWPLVHDMQVMHYVSFLIDRGWAPYRQIGDMNMPGAYLFEGWALHLFGSSDLGWRLYDFSLSAVMIAASISICRRYDWLAGLVAGGTFVMVHAANGPISAGQRDQLMAVLLVTGYAFCFESVRWHRAWLMLPFAFLVGMAASVKPTLVLLGPIVLLLVVLELRRQKIRWGAYVLSALAGSLVATAIVLGFLLRHQALEAFVFDLTQVIPHYATVAPASWRMLVGSMLPKPIFIYAAFAIATLAVCRTWRNWECIALLCGLFFGLFSYFAQRKGFGQHRYTAVAFLVLWGTIQLFFALRERWFGRALAIGGLAFAVLIEIPHGVGSRLRYASYDRFASTLERDMEQIGVARMQGQVQCLDIVDGCLNALYHLKIVQSTGSTGDLLLFLPQHSWVVDRARTNFFAEVRSAPPEFIVLTNEPFSGTRSFHKVDTWPEFASFLDAHYAIIVQREFEKEGTLSHPGMDTTVQAYRIFERRD